MNLVDNGTRGIIGELLNTKRVSSNLNNSELGCVAYCLLGGVLNTGFEFPYSSLYVDGDPNYVSVLPEIEDIQKWTKILNTENSPYLDDDSEAYLKYQKARFNLICKNEGYEKGYLYLKSISHTLADIYTYVESNNSYSYAQEHPEEAFLLSFLRFGEAIQSNEKKFFLVVFIGGITYGELGAIRYLNKTNKNRKFIVLTTSMINTKKIFNSLSFEKKTIMK